MKDTEEDKILFMTSRFPKILLNTMIFLSCGNVLSPAAPPNAIERIQSQMDAVVRIRGMAFNPDTAGENTAVIDAQTGLIAQVNRKRLQWQENKGAGVIISPDGIIVTNTHIIFGSHRILVDLHNGENFEAQVAYVSPDNDFSLLRIKAGRQFPYIKMTDDIELGEKVTTLGHSDILNGTISGGRVSGVGTRDIDGVRELELIKLNINHYSGDSGGPVFDQQGRLIGLISAKRLSSQKELIAVPVSKILFAYNQLDN